MGLIGAKISEYLKTSSFRTKKNDDDKYYQQTVLMVLIGFFLTMLSFLPYVSWAGNAGGFLCGFSMGIILLSRNIRKNHEKRLWIGFGFGMALLLITIMISMIDVSGDPDEGLANVCRFYDDIHAEGYDCMCGF